MRLHSSSAIIAAAISTSATAFIPFTFTARSMAQYSSPARLDAEKGSFVSDVKQRFQNVVKGIEDVVPKFSADETSDANKLPIKLAFIENPPSSSMTNGIDEFYVKLCSTISGCMYNKQPPDISQFSNLDQGYNLTDVGLTEPPKVLLLDDHGIFEATNPPFSVTVAGKKMILAWRGSHSIMDWVRDFGFYIASSFRWKNVADVVSVQGGYLTCVESCMVKHEDFILDKIKEYGVTEILLTGHSLAGGVAQVAHLWFTGTMDPDIDPTPNPWKALKKEVGLAVKTMSFEGPMTTVFVKSADNEELNKKGIDFLNKCSAGMCTTCYHMDVVPRMYGNLEFGLSMVENLLSNLISSNGVVGLVEKDVVEHFFHSAKALSIRSKAEPIISLIDQDIVVARHFQHLGHVLYYDSPTSPPKVYIDNPNGILTDAEGKVSQLPQFRDIKYVPVKTSVVEAMFYDHEYMIFGPGLCLNEQSWFEKSLQLSLFVDDYFKQKIEEQDC